MKQLTQIDAWLAPEDARRGWFDPIFRMSTSLIFIVGGIGHFIEHDYMLERMAESPWRDVVNMIGDPSWLLWLSGVIFVIFGITLALGILTRFSALLLLVTLIPITITVHVAPGHMGPFLKNIAIMGALLYFYANGPGRFAIDRGSDCPAPKDNFSLLTILVHIRGFLPLKLAAASPCDTQDHRREANGVITRDSE